jgi:LPXTG-motif cell wall-anchored protein
VVYFASSDSLEIFPAERQKGRCLPLVVGGPGSPDGRAPDESANATLIALSICGQTGVRPSGNNISMDTNTLIIIILVVLLLGGGGFFYRGRR